MNEQLPGNLSHRLTKMLSSEAFQEVLDEVEKWMEQYPASADLHKIKGIAQIKTNQLAEAVASLKKAQTLAPDQSEVQYNLAIAYYRLGRTHDSIRILEKYTRENPHHSKAIIALGKMLVDIGLFRRALECVERAGGTKDAEHSVLMVQGEAYYKLNELSHALDVFRRIAQQYPGDVNSRTNLANTLRMLGEFNESEKIYHDLVNQYPDNIAVFSNYFYSRHYNPAYGQEDFWQDIKDWDQRFCIQPALHSSRQALNPAKKLRIGFVSSGFRVHPVGNMIASVVENLPKSDFELIAYPLSYFSDHLTRWFKETFSQWRSILHLKHDELADFIREDNIDILIDLCGHSEGQRLKTIALKPAPLIVKWVGGLINTTGPAAIDYLISDHVETPAGVDDYYIENLIRMPDDYICYLPPRTIPEIGPLPAERNGFITLGCFNNPTKLNDQIITHWSRMMQSLPNSRLFLKGGQYSSTDFVERVVSTFERNGIASDRLVFEPFSPQKQLLEAYNRVDIALDPWPYSGGLTTCEALLMGVPVVTMPGPTFAGRHSATHLTHAGLPELVVGSWEEYEHRVIELASDRESLKLIRQTLRQQLLQSPVCDGPRYARHFAITMRAIWQRYCAAKPAAALSFDAQGEAWFEGDQTPVRVDVPEIVQNKGAEPPARAETYEVSPAKADFRWQLPGKILVIDSRSKLLQQGGIDEFLQLNAFGIVAFDPASQVQAEHVASHEEVQYLAHAALGDGQPATLYTCLDPKLSSTLEPFSAEELPATKRDGARVLAKLPISTVALNSVAGLESLDWLILDQLSAADAILEHGDQVLKDSLLIQVRIAFQPTHHRQPNLAELQHWMARHGFRFYRLNDMAYESHLPTRDDLIKTQSSELVSADVLFLPDNARIAALSDAQRLKLAFLLHTVFNVKDLTYALLAEMDADKAEDYLLAQGMAKAPESAPEPRPGPGAESVPEPAVPTRSNAARVTA